MKREFLTISAAAAALGCSAKTLQRYIASHKLKWHANKRPARGVKGIELSEAAALQLGAGKDGHTRHGKTPAIAKLKKYFRLGQPIGRTKQAKPSKFAPCPEGKAGIKATPLRKDHYAPSQVVEILLNALANDEDIDFMAYCIQKFAEGNEPFIRAALGENTHGFLDPVAAYAANRLRTSAVEGQKKMGDYDDAADVTASEPEDAFFADRDEQTKPHRRQISKYRNRSSDLDTQWKALAFAWSCANIAVEPAVIYDRGEDTAALALAPEWTRLAPGGGLLPELGGKFSVAKLPRIKNSGALRRGVLKVARALDKQLGTEQNQSETVAAYNILRLAEFDGQTEHEDAVGHNGTAKPKSAQTDTNGVAAMLYARFGLTQSEGRAFVRAMGQLTPDALARPSTEFNESLAYDVRNTAGMKIPLTTLAKVFGISRQTAAKWMAENRRGRAGGGRRNRT